MQSNSEDPAFLKKRSGKSQSLKDREIIEFLGDAENEESIK